MSRKNQAQRKTIGEKIKELREARGWNQSEFAKQIGLYRQQDISYWESGKRTPPLDTVVTIAQVLGTTTDYLLGNTDVSTTDKDLRFVCDYTGLSEEAIALLHVGKNLWIPIFIEELIDMFYTPKGNEDIRTLIGHTEMLAIVYKRALKFAERENTIINGKDYGDEYRELQAEMVATSTAIINSLKMTLIKDFTNMLDDFALSHIAYTVNEFRELENAYYEKFGHPLSIYNDMIFDRIYKEIVSDKRGDEDD